MSTVEVTRRLSEERDVLHSNSTDDKDRRLQRWRDKLAPRDEDAAATSAAANAVKIRRDRSTLIDKEPQVGLFTFSFLFINNPYAEIPHANFKSYTYIK